MHTTSFSVYVDAAPEQVWQALTDGRLTRRFYFGLAVESDWRPESAVVYRGPGPAYVSGWIVHAEPPSLLVHSVALGDEEAAGVQAWLTWEVDETANGTRVTLRHDDLEHVVDPEQDDVCLRLISNLKTLLEAGAVRADGEITT